MKKGLKFTVAAAAGAGAAELLAKTSKENKQNCNIKKQKEQIFL